MTAVPFFDLKALHDELKVQMLAAFEKTVDTSHLILGPELEAFETEFAAYCGARHCIGVGNGLDALKIILLAMGIGAGDEVIVPAHTFIATWLAVGDVGATPVGVDIDLGTYNLDPTLIEAAITPRTRAIMPVHLYGRVADMAEIRRIADRHKLLVVEDAAQAHGATGSDGRRAGALGNAAAFSFYPTKNLGALGDGGAVVTDDDTLAAQARLWRNYGSTRKYQHELPGFNSRLDELQAAMLRLKLPGLDAKTKRRVELVKTYYERLRGLSSIELPAETAVEAHAWHLFVIRAQDRQGLVDHLTARGVATLIHYPTPPHLQPAYRGLGYAPGAFPKAEQAAREVLSLPLWPEMSAGQQSVVVEAIAEWDRQQSLAA